jgi:hypothetical protein
MLVCAALAVLAPSAAAQTMVPGEWLFTSTLSSPLMPAPQESSFTQCVTQADAEDPTRFTARDQTADCEVAPGVRTAENYSWTVFCHGQGLRGSGTARFRGDTIESEMQVSANLRGQKVEMRTRIVGRRLGPCGPK